MELATEIAGDIVTAGTALGGLLLVYMGGVTTAFQSYDAAARPAILGAFSRRVWLGLTGFIPSLAAAAFAIAGKWLHSQCLVIVAIVFLGVAFVAITFAAIWTVLDIK